MSNEVMALTEFTYESMGVRVLGTKYEPWFVAVDVLRALDIHTKNVSRILDRLDEDEKLVVNLMGEDEKLVVELTTNSQGRGNPDVWLVSEPGLYKIMFRSRTPKAEAFTRFVTHEVLPSIRKYGYYKAPKPPKPPKRLTRGRPPVPMLEAVLRENERKKKYVLATGERIDICEVHEYCRELGMPYTKIDDKRVSRMIDFIDDRMKELGLNSTDEIVLHNDFDDDPDETYTLIVDGVPMEFVK